MNWSLPKKQEFPSHFKGFQYTFGLFCFHGCPLCYLVHPASGGGGCLLEESSPEMLHPCFGGSAFLLGRAWHRRILQIWGEGDMKRSILHALTGKRSSRPAESIWNEKKKKNSHMSPTNAWEFIQLLSRSGAVGVNTGTRRHSNLMKAHRLPGNVSLLWPRSTGRSSCFYHVDPSLLLSLPWV